MKKLIALLLAAVMLFGLTACGGGITVTGDNVAEDYNPDAQWSGIYTNPQWDGALPLVQPGEDNVITISASNSAKVTDLDDNAYTLWLEEQTGVDIQFISFSGASADTATQVSLMLAGGERLPDILTTSSFDRNQMKEYGRDGYLLNLADYLATDAYYGRQALELYWGDRYDWAVDQLRAGAIDSTNGAMYCYPTAMQSDPDDLRCHMWINQTWLDNLGLEAPTNIEELYNVLVAFRDQDPNQNGLKDEVPMIGKDNTLWRDIIGWVINAYVYYNPQLPVIIENDVVSAPYDQDEYRQALIFVKKLVDEGLLSPMTWTMTATEQKALVNPLDDFTVGIVAAAYDTGFNTGHESVYHYVPLAPLADETGRGGYGPINGLRMLTNRYITADCENPRLAFRLLDFMSSPEGYMRARFGERGVDWEYVDESNTLPGNFGGEARFVMLGDDVHSYPNRQTWGGGACHTSRMYWQFALDLSDGSWLSTQYLNGINQVKAVQEVGNPEQVMYVMERTDEEEELYNEYVGNLNTFIKQARANFCNGIIDPNKESDWQQYLNDLYGLNYQQIMVDIPQACWDRVQAR